MPDKKIEKKIVVVADDFTGSNDAGVQFRKAGFKVNVIIDTQKLKESIELAEVLVIDLESRFDSKETAYQKCYKLGKELDEIGNMIVYKKIDSTFRGNIGAEMDGLMVGMRLKLAVLAPALPSSGRTTIDGEVYVHQVRLADTEFSIDPRTPVTHSRIADIIALQSSIITKEIPTELFRDTPASLRYEIINKNSDTPAALIFDCTEEGDLLRIAELVESISDQPMLIVGSAGLANYIGKIYSRVKEQPVFVFAGSVSEQTRKQVNHAAAGKDCSILQVKAEDLLSEEFDLKALSNEISTDIARGIRKFIFVSAFSRDDVDTVFSVAAEIGISKDEAAEKVALTMGRIAAILIEEFKPSGVLLTGGDTAIKTVRALNGTGFTIDLEIVPGIPAGKLTGTDINTIIATKSGGFGADDAISKTLEYFKA